MSAPLVGSLCSGYGGLDLAVESFFGAETAWFAEFDDAPSKVLAHHWPGVPNLGDLTKIKWTPDCPECAAPLALYNVGPDAHKAYWCPVHGEFDLSIRDADPDAHLIPSPVDIVTGGTPCQDLSAAGRRRGMTEGTRSNLWVQMRECIAAVKPSIVIWENVRGAYSACADSDVGQCPGCVGQSKQHRPFLRALGRVLGDLSDLGFDAEVVGLRAADAGAPHSRFRVFVVAYDNRGRRGSIGRFDTIRCDADGRRGADAARPSREPAASVAESDHVGGDWSGRARDGWTEPANGDRRADLKLLSTPLTTTATGVQELTQDAANNGGPSQFERNTLPLNTEVLTIDSGTWGPYAEAIARWEAVLGRPAPAPTLPDGKGGRARLNAALVEHMMGLPEGWVTAPEIGLTRNEQLKALGDGVVPQQAELALTVAWPRVVEQLGVAA